MWSLVGDANVSAQLKCNAHGTMKEENSLKKRQKIMADEQNTNGANLWIFSILLLSLLYPDKGWRIAYRAWSLRMVWNYSISSESFHSRLKAILGVWMKSNRLVSLARKQNLVNPFEAKSCERVHRSSELIGQRQTSCCSLSKDVCKVCTLMKYWVWKSGSIWRYRYCSLEWSYDLIFL